MNPYDFVPVDWKDPPVRIDPLPHNSLNGLHGTIECRITAETPIFIPSIQKSEQPVKFIQNNQGDYFIQGSSLKGMLRNVIETVGPGCWLMFSGKYKSGDGEKNYTKKLPREFSICDRPDNLCPACRLFGIVNGDNVHYQGRVEVDDAICTNAVPHESIYTIALMTPKPHHEAWYLEEDTAKIAGRKYYFHQQEISTESHLIGPNEKEYNSYIAPLARGSTFSFKVTYKGLSKGDISLLLYALFLEENMRHKIGYAKPAGLGSVKIEPEIMTITDFRSRYKFSTEPEILVDNKLSVYIDEMTAVYRNKNSTTMNALRRIWKWPPDYQRCSYPERKWFDNNSRTPISET